ncbi:MAG: hypothetical protein N3B16_11430 [Candidatus Aminicenantes bacterium]|nr:hypothetical protein [Candidatus Aminicenantes bacterium]
MINKNWKERSIILFFFYLFLANFSLFLKLQAQENSVEGLLSRADVLYIQGDFEKARALYLEIIKLTDRNMYLSRAFFGAALCSFNLNDDKATKDYLLKVFSVDPKKEISSLFYPPSFVKIFQEVKQQFSFAEEILRSTQKSELIEEKGKKEIIMAEKNFLEEETSKKVISDRILSQSQDNLTKKRYLLGGHWEINFHYGRWGLDPVLSFFEKNLKKRIGSEIRQELTEFLSSRYGSLTQSSYEQQFSLEIGGNNLGIGLRYFYLGETSSFSLGLSLEKTHLQLKAKGLITQNYDNGSKAEIESEAFIQADPILIHFSFRWDGVPRSFLCPYFIFGFGYGPTKGKMGYSYSGNYQLAGFKEPIKDSKDKSFKQWQQEEQSHINLEKIILIQLGLGLRLEIYRGFSFYFEGNFWNGFLINGGLAFRL